MKDVVEWWGMKWYSWHDESVEGRLCVVSQATGAKCQALSHTTTAVDASG